MVVKFNVFRVAFWVSSMRVHRIFLAALIAFSPFSASATAVYWNLFNLEGESSFSSVFATYGTVEDMLTDTNRLASHTPTGTDLVASRNLVGTGSDGTTYWNLFNLEGESSFSAVFASYGTVDDMLTDTNRLASHTPTGTDLVASRNLVGTGAFFTSDPIASVPIPATGTLLLTASAVWAGWRRRSLRVNRKEKAPESHRRPSEGIERVEPLIGGFTLTTAAFSKLL